MYSTMSRVFKIWARSADLIAHQFGELAQNGCSQNCQVTSILKKREFCSIFNFSFADKKRIEMATHFCRGAWSAPLAQPRFLNFSFSPSIIIVSSFMAQICYQNLLLTEAMKCQQMKSSLYSVLEIIRQNTRKISISSMKGGYLPWRGSTFQHIPFTRLFGAARCRQNTKIYGKSRSFPKKPGHHLLTGRDYSRKYWTGILL